MAEFSGVGTPIASTNIPSLNTTDKTIPGAINELNSKVAGLGTTYYNSASVTISNVGIDSVNNGASITLPAGTYIITGRWVFQTGAVSGARNLQVAIANESSNVATERVYAAANKYAILNVTYIVAISAQTTYRVRGSSSEAISTACATEIRAVRIK